MVCAFFGVFVLLEGCSRNGGVDPHLGQAYPERLSEWRLFTATQPALVPNRRVLAYTLNTTLFSDYADKSRTVWMPPGTAAQYRADGVFAFPVGTILTKTFAFRQKDGKERLIETRVIVQQENGWATLPYVWNREQTDAVLDTAPLTQPVRWMDAAGAEHSTDYEIPNVNQCAVCHQNGLPLGPSARNLNHGNQLAEWVTAGYLKGVPAPSSIPRAPVWDDPRTASTAERASAYLEVNCNTCHRAGTKAGKLDASKGPEIIRRMESTDPAKRMPTLGHTVVHREAVALMRQWLGD
jgi:uncharacterized repeat protein (TIGR03806 family)